MCARTCICLPLSLLTGPAVHLPYLRAACSWEAVFLAAAARVAAGVLGAVIKLDLVADLPMDARNRWGEPGRGKGGEAAGEGGGMEGGCRCQPKLNRAHRTQCKKGGGGVARGGGEERRGCTGRSRR